MAFTKQMCTVTTDRMSTGKNQGLKQDSTSEWQIVLHQVRKNSLQTKVVIKKATSELLSAIENKPQIRFTKKAASTDGRVIPADAIPRFCEPYAYNAICGSVLELLFFQRFWISLSKRVPKCIMPCTITITGLAINLACCSLVLYHSPEGTREIPAWVMLTCAAGMFAYQTLDALDGKQASKLQNTHLEELADHGSDSLSTSFVLLAAACVLQLGTYPTLMMMFCVVPLLVFYSAHWQTHISDIVVFGKIDVTEGQCALMLLHIISAIFGQSFWQCKIPLINVQLNHLLVFCCLVLMSVALIRNLQMIFGAPTPLDKIIKLSRRKGLSIVYPVIPLGIWLFSLLYTWDLTLTSWPCLFCLMYGFIFTKLLVKMQVASMGKIPCEMFDSMFWALILLALNQHLKILPPLNALLTSMVMAVMNLLLYIMYLKWDICDFQDIHMFSLKYPVGHEKNQAGCRGIYINGINNKEIEQMLALQSDDVAKNVTELP